MLAHTADAGFTAAAGPLEDLFEEAAVALAELGRGNATARIAVDGSVEQRIELEADDLQGLAFAWLNELIGLAEVHRAAIDSATVGELERVGSAWRLVATVRLAAYRSGDILPGRQVKAATYHGLEVEPTAGGWRLTAYLDL